ncbi:hypothetical protein LUZ63_010213 [Rhynchospora breviuscula]|uniref:Disease resistance R13L4/SHOC-2-like LRR domain-containing protein n=1 Tax=Rhynchospora breviuscula TaxID=2022672 RepID=A0A9Q0CGR9_9POAL|nr:hypothetical protein LUZ63_010213 [Rhynchospora breviuscula]
MAIKPAIANLIDELTSLYRSLPPRPTIEEVDAAMSVVNSSKSEEEAKINELEKMERSTEVPEELFFVFKEAKRNWISLMAYEQRKEAVHVLNLDKRLQVFDELIQRASKTVSPQDGEVGGERFEEVVKKKEEIKRALSFRGDAAYGDDVKVKVDSFKSEVSEGSGDPEKLSLIQVASVIESSAKKESRVLNLRGKLTDQIEWLPSSLGKLEETTQLDLSENRITALPTSIGNLKSLMKLDLHSNQLTNLPESFGDLCNLMELDLHANRLVSLPTTIGKLINLIDLDLSSNQLATLPDSIGNMTNLKRLNVETNELEELPYTIGSCVSLTELRLDFNRLKALPEAVGKLGKLETLTLHYNRIKSLPTTMASLVSLRELDVSFNELESVPESLCLVTSLVRLNVSKNFADLRMLPRSIGNLEMLEELDISSDQIRILPDSFRFLSKLRIFNADETPLEVPPREIVKLGAQAVVQYMADLVVSRETDNKKKRVGGFWFWICSLFRPDKKRTEVRSGSDMV